MHRPKYFLEVKREMDVHQYFGNRFLMTEYLVSEGETLEELLENATYSTVDQDGGEGPFVGADDEWAKEYIIHWYNNQNMECKNDK